MRDFIHVTDLVSAHIMLMPKLNPQSFQCGTGRGHVLEFVACKNATGQNIAVGAEGAAAGGRPVWADPTAIEIFLGWQAKHTDVAEGRRICGIGDGTTPMAMSEHDRSGGRG